LGLTLEELGVRVERGKSQLSKIENCKGGATVETLEVIALHLGVEVVDFFVSPTHDNLRHRVIDATRGLSPDRLRAMLTAVAGPPLPALTTLPFEEVDAPRPGTTPSGVLPLVGLDVVAAGLDFESIGRGTRWVRPRSSVRYRRGSLVARVIGRSMEPTIRDGEYVVLSKDVPADLENGAVVLARYAGHVDADTAASFTVRRIHRVAARRGAARRWARIELRPDNPSGEVIVVEPDRAVDLHVAAVLVDVLRPKGSL